jgi:hypothetical protein
LVPADHHRKSRGSTRIFFKIGENQPYQSAKISGKKYPPADQRRKSCGSTLIFLKIGENQLEKNSLPQISTEKSRIIADFFRSAGISELDQRRSAGKNRLPQISAEKVADQRGSFLESAGISELDRRKSAGKKKFGGNYFLAKLSNTSKY